jgi:hypothetical protein
VYKTRFDQAKKTARKCLDACPEDVIRQFFNHSWAFHGCLLTRFDRAHGGMGRAEAEIAPESQTAHNVINGSSSQLKSASKKPKRGI